MDLTGQTILVTGGNGGIGNAIAKDLLNNGASVAIHYHNKSEQAETLKKAFPEQADIFQADLGNTQACQQLVNDVFKKFGVLHSVIQNAGLTLKSPLNDNLADWQEKWETTQQVNLMAPGIISKEAIRIFQEQGLEGRIIFISSRAAFRGDTPEYWAYAASKGGLHSLNKSIARYYGTIGVKSFEIAPGFVQTPMAQEFIDTYRENHVKGDLALNDLTQPQDIANWTTFLASGKADHATGTTIDVNAGSYVH